MLFKIAFVLLALASVLVGVPIMLAAAPRTGTTPWGQWIDQRLGHFGLAAIVVWLAAVVLGAVAW